jgi:hypothetical protein
MVKDLLNEKVNKQPSAVSFASSFPLEPDVRRIRGDSGVYGPIARAVVPLLSVLLAGDQVEDFFLIRDILERNQKVIPPELDRASSQSEAKTLLRRGHSGPVWFEHEMGDAATLSGREPGTVLRNRSAMEPTGCAPSAAR